jgi:diaminopimelate decarboxylase
VLALIDELRGAGIAIRDLDIGGGLGIVYKDEVPPAPQEYGQAIRDKVAGRDLTMIFEPGRVLVGNCGCFVTRVLYTKENEGKRFTIVDGAMNDLLRPALYDAYQEILPVRLDPRRPRYTTDVVGPICESGDFFARNRELPELRPGDLLAVMSAGAYGFSMASTYNTRPRVPEVLVKDDRFHIVRARETVEQLMEGENIPKGI